MEPKRVPRITVVPCINIRGFDDAALRYMILSTNSQQSSFEFEFAPEMTGDPFIQLLMSEESIARSHIEHEMDAFAERYHVFLSNRSRAYGLVDAPPDRLQLVTTARLEDNYYYTANTDIAVFALGGWRRYMAPPSILEFIHAMCVKDALWLSSEFTLPSHLATRGCINDFCAQIDDLRQKVLIGKVCNEC